MGIDKGWQPHVFVSKEGKITGFEQDLCELINQVSGLNLTLKVGRWKDMVASATRREIDGLTTSAPIEERKDKFNFSIPYMTHRSMVIVSKSNPKNIHSVKDLDGKIIAIQKSNAIHTSYAKEFNKSTILYLNSSTEVIENIIAGKVDAMFGTGVTQYFSKHLGFPYLLPVASLNKNIHIVYSLRKDYPQLLSIINKSLAYIGERKLVELKTIGLGVLKPMKTYSISQQKMNSTSKRKKR